MGLFWVGLSSQFVIRTAFTTENCSYRLMAAPLPQNLLYRPNYGSIYGLAATGPYPQPQATTISEFQTAPLKLPQPQSFHTTQSAYPQSTPSQSLYDRYNRNCLKLSDIHPQDLQKVFSSPIAHQQPLYGSPKHAPQLSPRLKALISGQIPNQSLPSQTLHKQIPSQSRQPSRETQLNEFLLNGREIAADKKKRKMEFLTQIEQKLSKLEREATEIQIQGHQQTGELKQIFNLHSKTKQAMRQDARLAIADAALYQVPRGAPPSPQPLTSDMDDIQLKCIIQDHHTYNTYLLELTDQAVSGMQPLKSKPIPRPGSQGKQEAKKQKNVPSAVQNRVDPARETVPIGKKSLGLTSTRGIYTPALSSQKQAVKTVSGWNKQKG